MWYTRTNITMFHYTEKIINEDWWPFFTKSPEEKESLSYKKGHFETQHVACNRTTNTASLTVAREDFSDNFHQTPP